MNARGLVVKAVLPNSPGAAAGLQVGDVITAVDGKHPGDDPEEPALYGPAGARVRLQVEGAETREVTVRLQDVL